MGANSLNPNRCTSVVGSGYVGERRSAEEVLVLEAGKVREWHRLKDLYILLVARCTLDAPIEFLIIGGA